MNAIENWYDNEYDEWNRFERHKIEFEVTKKYMDTYLKGTSLKILDIGGGPGRYSLYLAGKGHEVTLLDLSQKNIDVAIEKSREYGIELNGYIKGNALDLSSFHPEQFDVVLLMGPLYHLTKEEDRRKALDEALRLLKKGGLLIASFISNYAPMLEAFAFLDLPEGDDPVKELLHYLEDGENKDGNGFTTAYFTSPEEAQGFMAEGSLKQLAFAGVETVLFCKERELLNLPQEQFDQFINFCFALSQDKNLLGATMHYLYIGEKTA